MRDRERRPIAPPTTVVPPFVAAPPPTLVDGVRSSSSPPMRRPNLSRSSQPTSLLAADVGVGVPPVHVVVIGAPPRLPPPPLFALSPTALDLHF